jgi:hypothetical protein
MPTTIVTGRDITFTLATVNYDAQTTAVTLVNAPVITTYQTLDGKAYKHIDDQWTLNIELLADWGATLKRCGLRSLLLLTLHLHSHSYQLPAHHSLALLSQWLQLLAALLQMHRLTHGQCSALQHQS